MKINIFLGNGRNSKFKKKMFNLKKLFKIEHLIHLTIKKKENEFGFLCVFKCFYVNAKNLIFNK
jgi:hypothetical protein